MPSGVSQPGSRISRIKRSYVDKLNEAVEAVETFGFRAGPPAALPAGLIPIRNTTGADVARFDILGIDAPVISAADNAEAYITIAGFDGITPILFDHALKFVIVPAPIPTGGFGYGVATGLVAAKVDIRSAEHTHAGIRSSGGPPTLWSDFGGPGRIISQESGTGEKYCLLDLQPSAGPWIVEGFLAASMLPGTVNGSLIEPSTTLVRVWKRDSAGDLSNETGEDITIENVDDTAAAVEDAYTQASFDGVRWSPFWAACQASSLPDPSP